MIPARAALLALLLLASSPALAADPAPIVEAERAFAAAAQEIGVNRAFVAYAAEDGIVFAPEPKRAHAVFKDAPESAGTLRWWPVFAGLSQSGDLGFTTGPWVWEAGERTRHGQFFTVWSRQKDGSWRWLLDNGPTTEEPSPRGPDAPVAALPPGESGGRFAEVEAAEVELATALASNARRALAAALTDDARLMRTGPQPALGRSAFEPILAAGPRRIEAARIGGAASAAGDLAYTYGSARWEEEGKARTGHYLRIWQRRAGAWRLVVDEIVPAPLPPPPAAEPAASPAPQPPAAP